MKTLKNGQNTKFISSAGVPYWVFNIGGKYRVERSGKKVPVTKEIKENIKLVK